MRTSLIDMYTTDDLKRFAVMIIGRVLRTRHVSCRESKADCALFCLDLFRKGRDEQWRVVQQQW